MRLLLREGVDEEGGGGVKGRGGSCLIPVFIRRIHEARIRLARIQRKIQFMKIGLG